MPEHDMTVPLQADGRSVSPVELWEVTEQLLLSGLREHAFAKQLEHRLAFSTAIAARLTEGACAIDLDGRVTFLNPAAERMLGWLDTEARGREANFILQGLDVAGDQKRVLALDVPEPGMTAHNDHAVLLHKDGTSFPVAYAVAPIVVGQVVGTVVTFDTLTEVQRLKELQDEYIALMSHDLRTPLTTMIGYAELLLSQLNQAALERAARSAEAIVASGAMMERMLKAMLEHSQREAGHVELHVAPIDLVELVTHVVDQYVHPTERTRIAVEAVARLPVVVDRLRLERVILNLLTNACKYSAPTSPIVVRVLRLVDDAVVSVTDEGVGIDAEDLSYVFEKHYRARTAGTTAGFGLGLFGSRLIAEAHGGRIWAESAVGVGSTFTVSIPAGEP